MKKISIPIKAVLKSYKKRDFDKTIQRSELLKRNAFLHQEYDGFKNRVGYAFFKVKNLKTKTLKKVNPDNILLKLNYPVVDYTSPLNFEGADIKNDSYWKESINLGSAFYGKPANLEQKIYNKNFVLEKYKDKWQEFCERWLIEPEWNGDFQALGKYLRKPVEIYRSWDNSIRHSSLTIKISEWTTLDDIKSRWDEVEEHQNKIWGKRERRANFSRDLVWYDLAKQHNLRPAQIAKLWVKNYPEDIELLVIRQFRKKIEPADLDGRALDDKELLSVVKRGFLSSEYKESFEEAVNFYVTGKTENKNGTKYIKMAKPIVDVIKKAVERMEKQIWEEMLPPPQDSALFDFHPQRIS